ncbi:DUF3658 domain-containing protein [Metapseudomonas otitidis]|uniref:DUF1835 domain-containing protein n=1 Tax=Metapseudomonas otitidis TaxID=319939 RepID=UPI003A887511
MWHLVCGDNAAEGVGIVLGDSVAHEWLRVLRDDLAVGPLKDIEQPPCARRAAFWRAVWPEGVHPMPDFERDLGADAQWLAGLTDQDHGVTVWHGDSASEQLLLARVAAVLEHSDLPFWEVPCGSGDSSVTHRRAVAMHTPTDLAERYLPRQVGPERRHYLATQWRSVLAEGAGIRRWRQEVFHGEDFSFIDADLLQHCSSDWQPLARVMADVMASCDGFFATDFFLFWRARELAAQGRVEIGGEPAANGYGNLRVRRLPG